METSHLENAGSCMRGEYPLIACRQPFDFNNDGRTGFLVSHSDCSHYECDRNADIYLARCDALCCHRDIWSRKVWQTNDSDTDFT